MSSVSRLYCCMLVLVGLAGCTSQTVQMARPALGAVGLAAEIQLEQQGRWRFPNATPLTIVSVNSPAVGAWGPAMLSGIRQGFPRANVGPDRPTTAGLTLYLHWPALPPPAVGQKGNWLASLPERLGVGRRADAELRIAVVCIDNDTGQILHRGKLVLRGHWFATAEDWQPVLIDAFARYAAGIAAG